MLKNFKEIYRYREMINTMIKKDLRGRYKGSFLGFLWTFLNPLLQLFVYALVFPHVLRVEEQNYTMFVFVAIIPWTFFSTAITAGTTSVLSQSGLIKKVYFPREILPFTTTTSSFINFLLSMIIVLLALIVSGIGISKYIILLPIVILVLYIFSLALSFIVSAITVYVRDLQYVVNIVLMLLIYLTPILYNMDMFPESLAWVLNLNPLTHIIMGYKDILYNAPIYGTVPNLTPLIWVSIASVILLVIGYLIFKKLEKKFAEEL